MISFLVALGCLSARAQTAAPCPQPPNLVKPTVQASVTYDSTAKLYTYSYTVANGATSEQEISDFYLDVSPPVSPLSRPYGWGDLTSFAGRDSFGWAAMSAAPLPPGTPDVGQIPPGIAQIKPGASLGGFSFKSPNPPGPVAFYILGYTVGITYPSEEEAEESLEQCPDSTGDPFDLAVTGVTQGPADFVAVTIDIEPISNPAPINPKSQGAIPAAVLGSSSFDVTQIDPATVRFGPGQAPPLADKGHLEDVNGDGIVDMVFQFKTQQVGAHCNDLVLFLSGKTLGGQKFQGAGAVVVLGCKQ